jgi:voltage-gated potassium channel
MPEPSPSLLIVADERRLLAEHAPGPKVIGLVRKSLRQIIAIVLLLLVLTIVGTIGLKLTTTASWFDCLYMSVITLTTVGYGETIPLGTSGRIFVMVFLVLGIGVFTFSAFTFGSLIVSVQLHKHWWRKRMQANIAKLSGHFIVCGMGRMGMIICEYLQQRGQPFVVIDSDEQLLSSVCDPRGWLSLVGDATDDQMLLNAGVQRAQSLATVLSTDSDNVYVALSARMLAAKIQIIARASSEKAIRKLERAGATRVVSPFTSGAIKMARFMLSPSIEDFLEIADVQGHRVELVEVQISGDSPYAGKTLATANFRDHGVMIIGIRRANGDHLIPPPANSEIMGGDSLFAFGSVQAVNQICAAVASPVAQ